MTRKTLNFKNKYFILAFFPLLGLLGCGKATTVPTIAPTPTPMMATVPIASATPSQSFTPTNVSVTRDRLVDFITSLSIAKTFRGSISGQNANQVDLITNDDYGYHAMIEALHDETGEWPGIIGVEYEYASSFTPGQLSKANKILINYTHNGGIVMITLSPQNPWVNDETNLAVNPGTWDGPSRTESKLPPGASLDDLLNPEKPVYASWKRKLDRIAGALLELKNAGVVVLFRPMQEMNASWYWWGISSHLSDPKPYIRVFRAMHDYFTKEKGLDNLIWVYSPVSTYGNNTQTSPIFRAVDWDYPGDDYIDIIAGTNYADDMSISDYETYIKMGKPLGIAEYGPGPDGPYQKNGGWDLSQIIERIKNDYPRIAFWVCWNSYPWSHLSMVSNINAKTLLTDPFVINRDDLPWNTKK